MDDPKVQTYLQIYTAKFPGLFDPTQRRTDVLAKTQHRIDAGDNEPLRQPPRRFGPAQEQATSKLTRKLIRRSKSPWAWPSHLVPKKPTPVGSGMPNPQQAIWRFRCNNRQLNARTKKHAHPMPNAIVQIQRAAGHRWYIDLKDRFWHVQIAPKDIEKTAFITGFGLEKWLGMPFGLCNTPATFQELIEEVYAKIREITCRLVDDTAVWADTKQQL